MLASASPKRAPLLLYSTPTVEDLAALQSTNIQPEDAAFNQISLSEVWSVRRSSAQVFVNFRFALGKKA